MLDLTVAIAKSSDVYFYKLASQMGIDRLASGLAPFGYGQLTGIDISGEKPGLLPSPAWKKTAFKRPADQVLVPGRDREHGGRSGLSARDPAATGTHRRCHQRARPAVSARGW